MDTTHQPAPAASAPAPAPGRWAAVQPWVTLLARLALAGVLGYAAYTKLPPALSVQSVEAYQLFSPELAQLIGYTLPLLEFALALLLVIGLATRYVGAATGLLMAVFIAGIVSAWARGLAIDCGCFGTGGQVAPGETRYGLDIARDLGFMALAGITMLWPRSPLSMDRLFGLYR
ncbi:MauE/DoxX family redox-associated membrane protein [Streptomonospora nanhaiensis]|uniref:Putative membrane protein YphA (DoxX/SURF4 family) n=1 Tax=Streptomonospora nanhaiensis TaxID=1323731 RepID=A0A853BJU2_9ACTN|nr:MauE/DoxX family redox-associated membrane protein [Streptomonospora nanhaiensis]MBV2362552.1 DoxX family membrane protein [Streptomonospora nanhaiensis]MBX9391028.1 DoxX family membrane protein [Streptomonospora nanhaiensis]NYI94786.1 putative membrane protein YphA (DoxX/SURF4 family) [Streptomonospora nanhaiensis]